MTREEPQLLGPTRRALAYFTAILASAGTLLATSSAVWANPVTRTVGAFSFACIALWVLYDTHSSTRQPRGVNNDRPEPMFSELEVVGARLLVVVACATASYNVWTLGHLLPDTTQARQALVSQCPPESATVAAPLDKKLLQANHALLDSLRHGMNAVLVGPPGSGKSTLLNAIRKERSGRPRTFDFSAAKRARLAEPLARHGVLMNSGPVADGVWMETGGIPRAFGALTGFTNLSPAAFDSMIREDTTSRFVIVDGLDEISKPSLADVWAAADMFVRDGPRGYQFVLSGRPEAFPQFMAPVREPTDDVRQRWPLIFEIQPMSIGSANELDSALATYLSADRSPIRALRRTPGEADEIRRSVASSLWKASRKHAWLRESIASPYGLRILSELCLEQGRVRDDWDEGVRRLQRRAFDLCVKRAMESHNRPSQDVAIYRDVIRDIAVRYASEVRKDGTFRVGPLDEISVRRGDRIVGFARVTDILDRSGFVYLKPLDSDERRYRFYPLWLHEYLVWEHSSGLVGPLLAEYLWLPRNGLAIVTSALLLAIAIIVERRGSRQRERIRRATATARS